MGSVGDYNDLFDKYPKLMGGAIWEWEDQGIWNRRDPNHPFLAYGGGFGDFPNDKFFIHKGVVFSDRTLKPHYPELKRAYQWISFTPLDIAQGKIGIRNRYAFTNLKKFSLHWALSEDGVPVEQGDLAAPDLAPGATTEITIPYKKIAAKPGREYFLQISFNLATPEIWAKQGYEVATAQFMLPTEKTLETSIPAKNNLSFTEDANQIQVTGDKFSVSFDKAQGLISQITRDQLSLLAPGGGPKLYLWRAPHRNDDVWASKEWDTYGINTPAAQRRQHQGFATLTYLGACQIRHSRKRAGWMVGHSQGRLHHIRRWLHPGQEFLHSGRTTYSSRVSVCDLCWISAMTSSLTLVAVPWKTIPIVTAAPTLDFTRVRCTSSSRLTRNRWKLAITKTPAGLRWQGRDCPLSWLSGIGNLMQDSALPYTDGTTRPRSVLG